jgi:hypothetical protein
MERAMALEGSDYATLAAVLVVLLAVLVYNHFRTRHGDTPQPQAAADAAAAPKSKGRSGPEPTVDPLLSRFAHHEGEVVGETVAVEGDNLILKQAGVFKAVPRAAASLDGTEVKLTGAIDWDQARAQGAGWLERSRKGVDEAVTTDLTRSEDVRSPALEAFKAREAHLAGRDVDGEEE